jgi:hypothetical protein
MEYDVETLRKKQAILNMPEPECETLQETLAVLVAEGLIEIKGERNGRPVYVLTELGEMVAGLDEWDSLRGGAT